MNTKALRQKILDLAIRGKLVPQDPNDEPASVLLERIRAEKQQMVKDGKLKPKDIKNDSIIFKGEDNLHYEKFPDSTVKCIEDEIPFELPQGWEWCRLYHVSEIVTGSTPNKKKPEYYGNDFPFFKPADLEQGSNVVYASEYLSFKGKNASRVIPAGSTAVCCIGSIGKCGYLQKEGTTNQQINSIVPYVYNKYVYYYCLSDFFVEQLLLESSATTIAIVNKNKMSNVFIPIPPAHEQKRIVAKLNEYTSIIDTIETNQTDLKTTIHLTKSKILDLAIRGKLVPQDPNDEPASVLLERIRAEKEELIRQGKIKRDKKESVIYKGDDNSYYEKIGDTTRNINDELPFELPEGWCWCRGNNCFRPMESRKPTGDIFKYIDIDSIDNKHQQIKEAKLLPTEKAPSRASRAVYEGSVLFSLVRPYLKNIALVNNADADSIASTGFYICTTNGTYIPDFLYLLMISPYVVNGLNQFMKGDNSPSINKDDIEKWLYPVPPLTEQKRIFTLCLSMIEMLTDIEKSLS